MTAEMLAADPELELELDRCIDQLLSTGGWEVRIPSAMARGEIDRLMGVAALLRSLTRHTKTKRPRPNQKNSLGPSVSNSFHLWRAPFSRRAVDSTARSLGSTSGRSDVSGMRTATFYMS